MNMEQIEAFTFIALTGNFSKTAELLFLSQPTVSMRIKTLENELGCKLFQRSGHSVSLTKEGEVFLPFAKNVLQSYQAGQAAIARSQGDMEGVLVLSSVFSIAFYILPSVMEQFQQLYPKIKLTVLTGHSHQVLDTVLKHEVSFGITRTVTHPTINRIQLMSDEMVLTIYPGHPFQQRKNITLEEVARERFILFHRGSLDWKMIHTAISHYELQDNVVMEADNIEVVKRMVKQKLGIAFLPRFSIEQDLDSGELFEVDVVDMPQINRNYELIYVKDTPVHGVMKTFLDFLMENETLQKRSSN